MQLSIRNQAHSKFIDFFYKRWLFAIEALHYASHYLKLCLIAILFIPFFI